MLRACRFRWVWRKDRVTTRKGIDVAVADVLRNEYSNLRLNIPW